MVAKLKDSTSAAPAASRQGPLVWRKTFPGTLDQPAQVRRELVTALQTRPDLDEILLVASELCTNAVIHTRSGHQGGTFMIEVTADGESLLIAVTDSGAPTEPRLLNPAQTDTNFRGLYVVKALSDGYGVHGDAEGRTVWALFASSGRVADA